MTPNFSRDTPGYLEGRKKEKKKREERKKGQEYNAATDRNLTTV